ncbi:MAG: hypothetical protein HDQ93_05350 [Desulfovibrio sp.]|nr:hypothetical protein [Desulfovibrio sp.]
MTVRQAIADALQGVDGGYSAMRIVTMLVCLIVLLNWVIFCFVEGRFVPISWEMVALIAGSQGAKAAQLRFELGNDGLHGFENQDCEDAK